MVSPSRWPVTARRGRHALPKHCIAARPPRPTEIPKYPSCLRVRLIFSSPWKLGVGYWTFNPARIFNIQGSREEKRRRYGAGLQEGHGQLARVPIKSAWTAAGSRSYEPLKTRHGHGGCNPRLRPERLSPQDYRRAGPVRYRDGSPRPCHRWSGAKSPWCGG